MTVYIFIFIDHSTFLVCVNLPGNKSNSDLGKQLFPCTMKDNLVLFTVLLKFDMLTINCPHWHLSFMKYLNPNQLCARNSSAQFINCH